MRAFASAYGMSDDMFYKMYMGVPYTDKQSGPKGESRMTYYADDFDSQSIDRTNPCGDQLLIDCVEYAKKRGWTQYNTEMKFTGPMKEFEYRKVYTVYDKQGASIHSLSLLMASFVRISYSSRGTKCDKCCIEFCHRYAMGSLLSPKLKRQVKDIMEAELWSI